MSRVISGSCRTTLSALRSDAKSLPISRKLEATDSASVAMSTSGTAVWVDSSAAGEGDADVCWPCATPVSGAIATAMANAQERSRLFATRAQEDLSSDCMV